MKIPLSLHWWIKSAGPETEWVNFMYFQLFSVLCFHEIIKNCFICGKSDFGVLSSDTWFMNDSDCLKFMCFFGWLNICFPLLFSVSPFIVDTTPANACSIFFFIRRIYNTVSNPIDICFKWTHIKTYRNWNKGGGRKRESGRNESLDCSWPGKWRKTWCWGKYLLPVSLMCSRWEFRRFT